MPSPKSTDPTAWDLVRNALRPSLRADLPDEQQPPLGFATRLAANYAALHREEKTRLWVRLSLQGAFGSAAIFLVAGILAFASPESQAHEAPALLVAPALDLPAVR